MATLSMLCTLPAALEVLKKSFGRCYFRLPAQLRLQLLVAVTSISPLSVPTSPVEDRRQLPLRPLRVLLPQTTQSVADTTWNVERLKASHMLLVQTKKLAAGGQVIVHQVEDFAIDTRD